jgi:FtsH-binding integral membrane protein
MATNVAHSPALAKPVASVPGRRYDHYFFSGTAWLMLACVVLGFGPTYYFAGIFNAPLPSPIIHIHAAVFSGWILLLIAQNSLAWAGRVDIHRKMGLAGFALAGLMVLIGWTAATDRLARGTAPPGLDTYFFYIVPMTDMVIFGTLISFAFRARRDAATHKRIIYIATVGVLLAAIARFPLSWLFHNPAHAGLASYTFLLMLAAYDLWSTHKVHRATISASAFLILVQQIRLPIGRTGAWHAFAAWAQSAARGLF